MQLMRFVRRARRRKQPIPRVAVTQTRIWLQTTSDIAGLPQTLQQRTVGALLDDAFRLPPVVGECPVQRYSSVE